LYASHALALTGGAKHWSKASAISLSVHAPAITFGGDHVGVKLASIDAEHVPGATTSVPVSELPRLPGDMLSSTEPPSVACEKVLWSDPLDEHAAALAAAMIAPVSRHPTAVPLPIIEPRECKRSAIRHRE
jgi:hypothetical protein